jgi:hypothetical protein
VTAVCKQAQLQTNALNDPRFRSPASVAAYLTTVTRIANWRLAQFRRLRPSGDVSFWASDASDWGSFMGRAAAATNVMGLLAKQAASEAPTRHAGRAAYHVFYAVDDKIGAAADQITNAPNGIPDCYSPSQPLLPAPSPF